jgi:hypothetical protein
MKLLNIYESCISFSCEIKMVTSPSLSFSGEECPHRQVHKRCQNSMNELNFKWLPSHSSAFLLQEFVLLFQKDSSTLPLVSYFHSQLEIRPHTSMGKGLARKPSYLLYPLFHCTCLCGQAVCFPLII